MARSEYQEKLMKMLDDKRIFNEPLNKVFEKGVSFSLDSVSCLLRAEEEIIIATRILTGTGYQMEPGKKLEVWAGLGAFSDSTDLRELNNVLVNEYNFIVKTLLVIAFKLVDEDYSDENLKEVAVHLLATAKEVKAFAESLK